MKMLRLTINLMCGWGDAFLINSLPGDRPAASLSSPLLPQLRCIAFSLFDAFSSAIFVI
jgi:hypothetical protein